MSQSIFIKGSDRRQDSLTVCSNDRRIEMRNEDDGCSGDITSLTRRPVRPLHAGLTHRWFFEPGGRKGVLNPSKESSALYRTLNWLFTIRDKMEERMMKWMQNNAKEQEKKIEKMNQKQMDRLEEVFRNGMQEMKATVSEQNMAGMAGIAALNTKMDVLRREVKNEESAAAPNFLEFIRSVNGTESPELEATVKTIEELIPMIPKEKS